MHVCLLRGWKPFTEEFFFLSLSLSLEKKRKEKNTGVTLCENEMKIHLKQQGCHNMTANANNLRRVKGRVYRA